MIRIYENPPEEQWPRLCQRPQQDTSSIEPAVEDIMNKVRCEGDKALLRYTRQLDGAQLSSLMTAEKEFASAAATLSDALKTAIGQARENIENFHRAAMNNDVEVEVLPGVVCRQKKTPIGKVGLYIPGGSAPLFSTVLMLAVPARLAGCEQIIICTPPRKDGTVHPAILYAAQLCGTKTVFKLGGAQAIAALTFGTESVPAVDKLFGPGNAYVTLAKQMAARYGVAIDMPAGPSEVLVIADDSANPRFTAADLLAQAEHGLDSQAVLLSNSKSLIERVWIEIQSLVGELPRRAIIEKSLQNSRFIVFDDLQRAMEFSNAYAPEHLILQTDNALFLADKVRNAASVFVGAYSPEAAGDYASGPNHTLPTYGFARNHSGLSVDSFRKTIFFQQLSRTGLQALAPAVQTMAEAEQLQAHALSVTVRMETMEGEL